MISYYSLGDSKSPQVSRALRSILADLNDAVVWMAFTFLVIFKSYSKSTIPLLTVPKASFTTGINVTFIFLNLFFNSLARSKYLSFFSLFQNGQQSPQFCKVSLFCWLSLGMFVWPRLGDTFVSQNPRAACVSHSPGQMLGCAFTICLNGQTLISCTISNGSPSPPCRV